MLLVSMHVSFLLSSWPETCLLALIISVLGGIAIENRLHLQVLSLWHSSTVLVCTISGGINVNLCSSKLKFMNLRG